MSIVAQVWCDGSISSRWLVANGAHHISDVWASLTKASSQLRQSNGCHRARKLVACNDREKQDYIDYAIDRWENGDGALPTLENLKNWAPGFEHPKNAGG